MSKGFFRTVLSIAAIAVQFIPGIGQVASLAITLGLTVASSLIGTSKPKSITDPSDRLNSTFDVNAPRKIVYGTTGLATDIRYQSFTGTDDQYFWQVICLAGHRISTVDQIFFDNELAWTPGGGMLAKYSPWTQVMGLTGEGTTGGGYAIDSRWTSNCSLTGCAWIVLRFKLRGDSDKDQSIWAGGVSSRMTFRGQAAQIYDPRLDSTRGGSGTARANDQSTWGFNDTVGNNPALQLLHFMLGWKIGGKLALGMGIPPARIDFASFITAANICDESVTLAAGGTERRYRSAGIVSETDDRTAVIANLCQAMNGFVRDSGGKLSLQILVNDLAAPVADFSEADIIGEETWSQTPSAPPNNVMRGRWVDPSDASLYAPLEFPEVRIASFDGIDRIDTLELSLVQSAAQAQRIAKTKLQRAQYQGRYTATFNARAWQVSVGDLVRLSHAGLGFVNKLFRVVRWSMNGAGLVQLELLEESASIYAWSTEDVAPVTPAAPIIYDQRDSYLLTSILQALTIQGVGGPASQTLLYDAAGTSIQAGGASLGYYLNSADGVVTTGTIIASYRVLSGTVNGVGVGSAAQDMTVSGGVATLDLTGNAALTSAAAVLLITITRNGLPYSTQVSLTRQLAGQSAATGGGSGGSVTAQNSGFSSMSGTSFAAVSMTLSYTLPTGKTGVALTTSLDVTPSGPGTGSWNIEGKWQRNTGTSGSPVWTDVGAVFSQPSEAYIDTELGGGLQRSPASLAGSRSDTGLTAGTTYEYRFVERINATGSTNTTRVHSNSGSLSITS